MQDFLAAHGFLGLEDRCRDRDFAGVSTGKEWDEIGRSLRL
jgi:hypothetical protein